MIFDFHYSDKSYLRYIYLTKCARAFPWNPFFDFSFENTKRLRILYLLW